LRGCLRFAGVGPGWSFGPFAGRLAPSDWAIVWAGLGPGWVGGVDWPRVLLGLVGPVWLIRLAGAGWPVLLGLAPLAGGDWRGVWGGLVGPGLIGAGLARAIGGAGRLAPDHANPGRVCNDFPVILPFL
jgi:hypothetical protein